MLDKEYDVHILRPRLAQTEEIGETANISSAKQFKRCEFFFSATHRMVPLANCVYHVSVVLEESWFLGAKVFFLLDT